MSLNKLSNQRGLVTGVLQVLVGLFRLGRLAFLAPSAVVHGMLSAIGVIILIKQVPSLLGATAHSKSILGMASEVPHLIAIANGPIEVIGIGSLALLLAWNKWGGSFKKILPGPLLAVIFGLICSVYFHISTGNDISMFGATYSVDNSFLVKVPTNLAKLIVFPSFDIIFSVKSLIAIFTIFLVCSLESLLSSYAVDKLDPYQRKSDLDKDILGKGVVNICCGLLGAYPIISEIVRSSANIENGAKTKWSNFFHGLFILVCVAVIPGILNQIPLASLAAVLLVVGFNLAHPRHFKEVYHHGKDQFLLFTTTLVITVVEDLLLGIFCGIALKIILHLIRGVRFKELFNPNIEIRETKSRCVVKFNSPAVFLGYLKVQSKLSQIPSDKEVVIVKNEQFIDFTIRELIKDSIHDAVDLATVGGGRDETSLSTNTTL